MELDIGHNGGIYTLGIGKFYKPGLLPQPPLFLPPAPTQLLVKHSSAQPLILACHHLGDFWP